MVGFQTSVRRLSARGLVGLRPRPSRDPGRAMSGIKAAVKAVVERLRKDERLAAALVVWLVLAAVLSASGAKPAVWAGLLLLAAIGALLSVLAAKRDKGR